MIREVRASDLDRCFEIESIAYDGSEAASREKIAKRIAQYPQGFLVLETEGDVVGFINSGATHHVQMDNEDIKSLVGHQDDGPHVVVMSVAVHPGFQRKGYASQLMQAFLQSMAEQGKESIHLICQERLIPFYELHGFTFVSPSASMHGGLTWVEMQLCMSSKSTKNLAC